MSALQASTEHAQTTAKHCGIFLHDDIISSFSGHIEVWADTQTWATKVCEVSKSCSKDLKLDINCAFWRS